MNLKLLLMLIISFYKKIFEENFIFYTKTSKYFTNKWVVFYLESENKIIGHFPWTFSRY